MPDCLTDIRHNLAAPRLLGKDGSSSCNLADMLHTMSTSLLDQIKSVLANLQVSWSKITMQVSGSKITMQVSRSKNIQLLSSLLLKSGVKLASILVLDFFSPVIDCISLQYPSLPNPSLLFSTPFPLPPNLYSHSSLILVAVFSFYPPL